MSRDDLLRASHAELAARITHGHAIDPEALAGSYRGTSLGLPAWLERATWKTFRKVFVHEPGGRARGWNVRLEQHAPYAPRQRRGVPWVFGHYEVVPLRPAECPIEVREGVLLDYGLGAHPRLDPTRFVRDPLVSLDAGSVDRLLGYTYVRALGRSFGTPSYFLLEREREAPGG